MKQHSVRDARHVDGRPATRRVQGAAQTPLQALAEASPPARRAAALQRMADGASPLQLGKKKGQKTTKDYVDDYEDTLELEAEVEADVTEELWSDEVQVIDYAFDKLRKSGYANWSGTQSPATSDYCRFIWHFDHDVTVGLNVHYTPGGKIAGNMYIAGISGFSLQTPAAMVNAAPPARPRTTMSWK
jgi:hypothetical protein